MKKIIKSVVSIAIPLSMCLFGSVTASAAPTDTTEEIIADEAEVTSTATTTMAAVSDVPSETESAAITSVPESGTPEAAVTGAPVTTAETTTTVLENPFEDGMLADDELFQFINDYLNDGVSFDVNGTGVLIGEDILNPEVGEDTDETEQDGESGDESENGSAENKSGYLSNYYSGEKLMYTRLPKGSDRAYRILRSI